MFERIKAYRTLRKSNKFIRGCMKHANNTEDYNMLAFATMALCTNKIYENVMWRKREMAVYYNKNIAPMFESIK